MNGFSPAEMMIVAAARELAGRRVCFVGVGLPNIAVNLAKRTVSPGMELVYEAGVFGARPARLPLSIGDPTIVTGATAVTSMFELFGFYLQGGLIDVGFLGAAQLDRFGNINTTVVGDHRSPKVRLPGAGGAPEIAASAREVIIMLRQRPRAFVEELSFVTSVGHSSGGDSRKELGYLGACPTVLITDLGVLRPDPETKEMTLVALHPGATVEAAKEATGWDLKVAENPGTTDPPTGRELRLLRELKARTEAARGGTPA